MYFYVNNVIMITKIHYIIVKSSFDIEFNLLDLKMIYY